MTEDQIYEILDEAWGMKNSPVKTALLEDAVRIADSIQHDELAVRTRMELIDSATFSGRDEKSLVAFGWCLSRFDEAPELFDEEDLLWRYKWIVTVGSFSHISLQRVRDLEDDMEKRYRAAGFNLRPVHASRALNAVYTGDIERAVKYDKLSSACRRDRMANCAACEASARVHFNTVLEQYEKSIDAAEEVFANEMSCSCVPQNVYGHILFPLAAMGRFEEGAAYQERGYRMIHSDPDYLDTISEHLTFLAAAGSHRKGLSLLTRHLSWALASFNCRERYQFYLAAGLFLEDLEKHAKKPTRKLRLPENFELRNESGEYKISDLKDWFLKELNQVAVQFDNRNGNSWYSDNIATTRTLISRQ